MKNFVQGGETIEFEVIGHTDESGVKSGHGYLAGILFGIAVADVAPGKTGAFLTEGVFIMDKAVGVWTQGEVIYWDPVTSKATGLNTDSGTKIGVAAAAAASGDATGLVLLIPGING